MADDNSRNMQVGCIVLSLVSGALWGAFIGADDVGGDLEMVAVDLGDLIRCFQRTSVLEAIIQRLALDWFDHSRGVGGLFGAFHGSHNLLKGSFGSLLEKSVHTLVEVIGCHVVIDETNARHKDSLPIVGFVHIVDDFGQLT